MKAHQFMPQIGVKRFKDIDWQLCAKGLILGYFLKMVIADNLKDQTFWLAYPHFIAYSPANLLIFLLGYSVQLFADFAGYSLIAIAVARLAGSRSAATISIFLTFRQASRTSGDAGTSLCRLGLGIICTFPWAAIARIP